MFIDWDIKKVFKKDKTAHHQSTAGYFDLGIAFWLLGAQESELIGLKKKPLEEAYQIAVARLAERGLEKIFHDIEMPLVAVLAEIELLGVGIDQKKVQTIAKNYKRELIELERKIIELAGESFNLNSPQQLSRILFEILKLEEPKKSATKTGHFSTNIEVLENLRDRHPIVPALIRYRELFKLQSTYLEPWQELGGRVRTTYLQTGTATGRLSSQNPNLQNVPFDLRAVFIPAAGYRLVACDYSQLQLRILASVTGDKNMLEAFANSVDIHILTASKVFKVPIENVTKSMRQIGKTLNFGVVYGMGATAFAKLSGLSRDEAALFIEKYFINFQQVREWHEIIKKQLRERGYVENLNGRRRWLLEVFSNNPREKAEAERAALNMPIQSLEADIIKMAMIKIYKELHPRMVLTVHDELVFELPDNSQLPSTLATIKEIMESIYPLAAPLKIEASIGESWGEL